MESILKEMLVKYRLLEELRNSPDYPGFTMTEVCEEIITYSCKSRRNSESMCFKNILNEIQAGS